jgi:D-beta-D-heptose 7-phosphate kinase/D-beta-D-heptose 1-phosphate adenosyltransferase
MVWGKVGRISPEAPVPVVEVTGESFYPGGAANVGRNLREFVRRVGVIGLIGTDRGGRKLHDLLIEQNIDTSNVIREEDFSTIVKTRIIARNQQVVRVDREQVSAPKPDVVARVSEEGRQLLPEIDAIIFEDYGKGFLSPELLTDL